jgi:hypothetical protein
MIKIILTLSVIFAYVYAEPVHSSLSTFFQTMEFKNSDQKTDGKRFGVGGDLHQGSNEYRFLYTGTKTKTIQPPVPNDLYVNKIYLRYGYDFKNSVKINLNYINVLRDNIVSTDGGKVYGAGLSYAFSKPLSANFTQFYSDYDDFKVHQSDFTLEFKGRAGDLRYKLANTTNYIKLDNYETLPLTKNADKDYVTSALKFHAHYKSYHFGSAAFFGKRVFAVMGDGFSLQHHAMEFDKTYVVGAGKTISDFVVRTQLIYQRAEELPTQNENVEINTVRFILNYKL